MEADLTAANELDEATRAEGDNLSGAETNTAVGDGEGSPSEPSGSGEPGTKEEGNEFQTILDENDITVDQLKDMIGSDKSLKDLLGDRKLEDVLEKAGKLDDYESQWKLDDEAKTRENESPEETIARLDQKISETDKSTQLTNTARREQQSATQALTDYDGNVDALIGGADISDTQKAFLKGVLQSSNPAMSVDIGNKADVGKMVKSMVTQLQAFSDGVIKDYTDGKGGVIPISPSTPASGDGKGTEPKTIAEATKGVVEQLRKVLR